jgi:hypothetical protein
VQLLGAPLLWRLAEAWISLASATEGVTNLVKADDVLVPEKCESRVNLLSGAIPGQPLLAIERRELPNRALCPEFDSTPAGTDALGGDRPTQEATIFLKLRVEIVGPRPKEPGIISKEID